MPKPWNVKQQIKRTMFAVAPEWTTELVSARSRAISHRLVRQWGLNTLAEKLLAALGPEVQSGPFRGMKLTPMSFKEHISPFLLGTYESELHPWIARLVGGQYSQMIDVGAKFGYYAVGLARLFPETPIVAFDTDWWARAACRELIAENRTPNVQVAGFCSPAWFDRNLMPSSMILSDCEGYEGDLFTKSTCNALNSATLIIETHDFNNPGVTEAILKRFAGSHRVETVDTDQGTLPTPPVDLSFLTPEEANSALRERRPHQTWLLLTPNARPSD
jgi:hypothetical protein